jgi:methionyl-tRNA formyltransferase
MEKIKTTLFLDNSIPSKYLFKKILYNKSFQINCVILSTKKNKNYFKSKNIDKIFISNLKKRKIILNFLKKKQFLGFSYYNYKIPVEIIKKFKKGIINFHPSYLPYNKGRHSAFWSIYSDTPMGASSHWVNKNFDQGNIFLQKKIILNKLCTAKDVYINQIKALKSVINNTLNYVSNNKFFSKKQKIVKNSYHYKKDLNNVCSLDLTGKISERKLVRIIRGTNFNNNGFFIKDRNFIYKIVSTFKFKKRKRKKKDTKIFIKKFFKKLHQNKIIKFNLNYYNYLIIIKSKIFKI